VATRHPRPFTSFVEDQLGLVQPVEGLGHSVVVGVTRLPTLFRRRPRPAARVADGQILHAAIAVVHQPSRHQRGANGGHLQGAMASRCAARSRPASDTKRLNSRARRHVDERRGSHVGEVCTHSGWDGRPRPALDRSAGRSCVSSPTVVRFHALPRRTPRVQIAHEALNGAASHLGASGSAGSDLVGVTRFLRSPLTSLEPSLGCDGNSGWLRVVRGGSDCNTCNRSIPDKPIGTGGFRGCR